MKSDTRNLLQQVTKEHVQQALTLLQAGRQNAFAESTKYDLIHEGKRYPPKRVAGVALEILTGRSFKPSDFKGGEESVCFGALRRAGYTVVPKHNEALRPIGEDFAEVLDLQTKYSSKNSADMARRGELIRTHLPKQFEAAVDYLEPIFASGGYSFSVEGSDGIGRKAESAWVRIFDEVMSPSATQGWYVVIHFSRTGGEFFLTLGCGATVFKDGFLGPIPDEVLTKSVSWARSLPDTKGFDPTQFDDPIDLHGNDLSRSFEKATAYAKKIKRTEFNEATFWKDLQSLVYRLVTTYDSYRLGVDPAAPTKDLDSQLQDIERAITPKRNSRGQGRGLSGPERLAVEMQAMSIAQEGLKKHGFTAIRDVSKSESCDFKAMKDGLEWLIEVKGTTSTRIDEFLLTAAELKLHTDNKGQTVLCLVSEIALKRTPTASATGGKLTIESPWKPDEWGFEPTAYRAKKNA